MVSLGVDRITLAIGIFFIQQRSSDGIRQTIDRAVQGIVFDFKIEGSAVRSGTGDYGCRRILEYSRRGYPAAGNFSTPSASYAQKMGQSLMLSGVLQRPTGKTTSADSDFTARGSETSSTTMPLSRRIAWDIDGYLCRFLRMVS